MKLYRATVSFNIGSGFTYILRAPNITHASQQVAAWDNVKVVRIQPRLKVAA